MALKINQNLIFFLIPRAIMVFLFSFVLIAFGLVVKAQNEHKSFQYSLGSSSLEIEKSSDSQLIDLAKKENNQEKSAGSFKIVDKYLISDLPEDDFLENFSRLKSGFKDLKISIEADRPIFEKKNFHQPKNYFEKLKNFFSNDKLSDFRLTKEIKKSPDRLESRFEVSDITFKSVYEDKEGRIKQGIFLENNSDQEINFQLTLSHSLAADQIFFNQQEYGFFETPLMLPIEESDFVYFFSNIPGSGNKIFTYNFSDLADFNPEVWIFRKNSEANLLVKTSFSVAPHSLTVIDPDYFVDVASASTSTAFSFQRKTWHDGSRYWVAFHSDQARIEFWYSTSGETWTENTNARIAMDTNDFSVDCDSVRCFIVYPSSSAYIMARKDGPFWVYPGPSFSWTNATTVNYTFQSTNAKPFVSRSSNGTLFVSYYHKDTRSNEFFAYNTSSSPNNINNWSTLAKLDGTFGPYHGAIVRSAGNRMLAVWVQNQTIESKKYTGSSWDSTATTVGYTYSNDPKDGISVVYDRESYDVHLTFNASSSRYPISSYKRYISESDAWATTVEIAQPSGEGLGSTINYNTVSVDDESQIYALFYENSAEGGGNYIRYRKGSFPYYNPSDWGSVTDLAEVESSYWLTSNFFPYTGFGSTTNDIFAIWTMATGTKYEVRFAKIFLNSAPSLSTVYLNSNNNINLAELSTTTVVATATVTDTNGYSDIFKVEGKIYSSNTGSGCSADYNDCYVPSCATSSCSGNSCLVTCTTEIWFHATPTPWRAWIKVVDNSNASSSDISESVDVNVLRASNVYSLYERYNTGDDLAYAIGGAYWRAQTFNVGRTGNNLTHDIQGLKIKMGRQGSSVGTGTLSIRALDANGAPTGTDLTSVVFNGNDLEASDQWVFLPLPSYSLASGTKYAIVLKAPYGNPLVNFLRWSYDSTPGYEGGETYYSENSGSSWIENDAIDFMFEELGTAGISYGNLSAGGDTGTNHEQIVVVNAGNSAIDVNISGTDLFSDLKDSISTSSAGLEFDPVYGVSPTLSQIDSGHYLLAYVQRIDTLLPCWAQVLQVNASTWAISTSSAGLEFEPGTGDSPVLSQIDSGHYLLAYTGDGNDGWAQVLQVNTSTWAISTSSAGLEFDPVYGVRPTLSQIDSGHYLLAYTGDGSDGWAQVLQVNTSTWAISTSSAGFEFDPVYGLYPTLSQIDSGHYLLAYTGDGSDGWAQVLETMDSIPVIYQHYSTSSLNYGSTSHGVYIASSTAQFLELSNTKPISYPSTSTDDIYWGLAIPVGQAMGYYSGVTIFEAVAD